MTVKIIFINNKVQNFSKKVEFSQLIIIRKKVYFTAFNGVDIKIKYILIVHSYII